MTKTKLVVSLFSAINLLLIAGCDPHRMKKCEWYLIPEADHRHHVEPGWVSLCARNPVNRKQRCMFKATLEYAEKVYGVKFRLSEMKYEEKPLPRKILEIRACE